MSALLKRRYNRSLRVDCVPNVQRPQNRQMSVWILFGSFVLKFEDAKKKHPQLHNCFQGKSGDVFFSFFRNLLTGGQMTMKTLWKNLKSSSTCSEEMVVSRTITVNSRSSECEQVPWDYDSLEVLGQGSAGKVLRARQDAWSLVVAEVAERKILTILEVVPYWDSEVTRTCRPLHGPVA